MKNEARVVIGAAAVLLSGAVLAAAADSDSPLAGTEWRLVEFQSMDDASAPSARRTPRSTPCA